MKLEKCRNCGNEPNGFEPSSGGVGVRCEKCGNSIWHPGYTWAQIKRVWNYRNSKHYEEN